MTHDDLPQPTPVIFHNGQWRPQAEAHIPIHDAGFVRGATITDLCRTVKHSLYRWDDHLARFRRGCRAARIFPTLAEEEIRDTAYQLIEHNVQFLAPREDLALVMLVTPGLIDYYGGEQIDEREPTCLMHTFPLPFHRYRRFFQQGVRLAVPAVRHVPAVCVDPRIKQRSRLHWWLAEQEAKQRDPQASALLLDIDGYVTETAAANFLIVKEGVVYSPPREVVLDGVSLQVVRELCEKLNISVVHQRLTVYDCLNADEAFVTSTPYCLAGVSHINRQPLPWPGPVFQKLLQTWSEEIELDVVQQILS